jgi:4-nitrophenyl phosphatase
VAFDFSGYHAVLLDLDGTLYKEDTPLPGAMALVRRLLAEGKKLAFISNSTQSPQRVAARVKNMGVDLSPALFHTASEAAAEYVLERFGSEARVFNCATEGMAELLEGRVIWVNEEHEKCDIVLAGNPQGKFATVPRMRIAMRLIWNGAICAGLCADRVYPSPAGIEIGSGAMTWMFAYAANVEPIFFGKPQRSFFENLCRRLEVDSERCVLVGDNLHADIGGGKAMGMKTILTLTGAARRGDLVGIAGEFRPDWVVEDLREL